MEPIAYNEYKFLVSNENLPYIRNLLDSLHGQSDPFPEGIVDSIYYDTTNQDCFHQCREGEPVKDKFRIRGYGEGHYIQVHHKLKDLFVVKKDKCQIEPVVSARGVPPSWLDLRPRSSREHEAFAQIMCNAESFGYLEPVLRVKYRRNRYRIYDYRMTLDTNVEVHGFSNGIDKQYDYAVLPHHVLEVKTIAARPYLPTLGLIRLPQISYSKFYLGLNFLIDGSIG